MANRDLPSPDVLRQLLRYDPGTGKLFWRERGVEWFSASASRTAEHACANWNARYAHKEALSAQWADSYPEGCVLGYSLKSHRVVWAIVHGEWPSQHIDHIDGDRSNNRIDNLRDVTHATNHRNVRKKSNNTSGFTGVSWSSKANKWRAHIKVDFRQINLGHFCRIEDAVSARLAAEKRYGFTERHGK